MSATAQSKLVWRLRLGFLGLVLLALAGATIGCGGGSAGAGANVQPASAVQVKMGDAPADRIVAFELTVNSVVLTDQGGKAFNALSAPTELELSHLADTNEPLSLLNVPQDTYTQLAISVSNPEVVYLNNSGTAVEKEFTFTQTVTLALNPPVVIGAGGTVVNLDLNLARSLALDVASGQVSLNPIFVVTTSAVPPDSEENGEDEDHGEMGDMWGIVQSVGSTSFQMSAQLSDQVLTINVSNQTEFEGVSGIGQVKPGMLLRVDAVTHQDGALLARKVELAEMQDGSEAEGIVTSVTGNPAQQFSVVLQDGAGANLHASSLGARMNVGVTSGTAFRVPGEVDLSNLPFTPAFDATTLRPGQRVEADTDLPISAASLTAESVRLQRQALRGTVSNYQSSGSNQFTFTLNLPADSYLTLLSGGATTSVTVVQQPGTELRELNAITDSASVRVRGTLFWTPGGFYMVASRISAAR